MSASSDNSPLICPSCNGGNPAGASYCNNCGALLTIRSTAEAARAAGTGTAPNFASGALPAVPAWATDPVAEYLETQGPRDDQRRTLTALTLMIVGFVLAWIPLVYLFGDLLAFIGICLLLYSRRAFGAEHQNYVTIGGVLILLVTAASIVLGIWAVAVVQSQVSQPGVSLAQLGSELQGDLILLFVAGLVLAMIGGFGEVLAVYALSNPTTRVILWTAFLFVVLIAIATELILVPQISAVISQATGGSSLDVGPVTSLIAEENFIRVASILPSLLFALAYLAALLRWDRHLNEIIERKPTSDVVVLAATS